MLHIRNLYPDSFPHKRRKFYSTMKKTSQDVLSIFRTPTAGYQDYTVVEIDATAFGGWWNVND